MLTDACSVASCVQECSEISDSKVVLIDRMPILHTKLEPESVSRPENLRVPANCPTAPTDQPALVRNVWQGTHA